MFVKSRRHYNNSLFRLLLAHGLNLSREIAHSTLVTDEISDFKGSLLNYAFQGQKDFDCMSS